MSSNFCYICNGDFNPVGHKCDIFFIWSTSRVIPMEKLMKIKGIKGRTLKRKMNIEGHKICFKCYNRLMNK